MIAEDSILRRLPPGIDPRQILFLDGIRHAGQMAALAHARLIRILTEISDSHNMIENSINSYYLAFLDAWSIVDILDRFRSLLRLFPVSENHQHSNNYEQFMNRTEPIRSLRNVADHLAQRVDYIISQKGTALGELSWINMSSPSDRGCHVFTIIPGTLTSAIARELPNPAGRIIRTPIDHIQLAAGAHLANLSEDFQDMENIVKAIEKGVAESIRSLGLESQHAGADICIKIEFKFPD